MEPEVLVERNNAVWTVTLNRPEVMNALSRGLIDGLRDAVDQLAASDEAKVIILTGAGGNFCSGADISLFLKGSTCTEWLSAMQELGKILQDLRSLPQPVITKLRGAAVGGGSNLALAGDLVVASHNTRFCENFVHLTLTLDMGGTYFLPRLVGLTKARRLAFLGEEIDGKTGVEMGLFCKSVPDEDLDAEVETMAQRLSASTRHCLSTIKEGLESSLDMTFKQVLERESSYQAILLQQPELVEIAKVFMNLKKQNV